MINRINKWYFIILLPIWLVTFSYGVIDYAKKHKGTYISDDLFVVMPIKGVIVETFRSDHYSFGIRINEDQYLLYRFIHGKYEGKISAGDSVYKEENWDYMIIKTKGGEQIKVDSEW